MIEVFAEVLYEQMQGLSIPLTLILSVWSGVIACIFMKVKAKISGEGLHLIQVCWMMLLVVSCCFIYQITMYNRISGSRNGIVVNPFGQLLDGDGDVNLRAVCYMFYNVLLFVPVGVALGGIKARYNPVLRISIVSVYGFVFALLVECVQLVSKRGYFETEDILANCIGASVGCGIFSVIYDLIIQNKQKRQEECDEKKATK